MEITSLCQSFSFSFVIYNILSHSENFLHYNWISGFIFSSVIIQTEDLSLKKFMSECICTRLIELFLIEVQWKTLILRKSFPSEISR